MRFNVDDFLEDAKRHRVSLKVFEEVRERRGCATEEFDFGDTTIEHCLDENQLRSMRDAPNMSWCVT